MDGYDYVDGVYRVYTLHDGFKHYHYGYDNRYDMFDAHPELRLEFVKL